MDILEVGGHLHMVAGKPEGVYADMGEYGYAMILNMIRPTDREMKDVSAESPFEIRETVIGDVLYFTVKCGSMPWMDAPFSPHLSRYAVPPEPKSDSEGAALTLITVDAATNVIKGLRLIGLGSGFSAKLARDIRELAAKPFSASAHDAGIRAAYARYSSDDIALMSRNYWKLR